MRNFFIPNCGIVTSSCLIIVGLFFLFIFPPILQFFVNKEFGLSPTSQSFKHWRKTPLPVTLDFYLFNWTNPGQIATEKPVFTELGPYRFYETRERLNLTWNDNGTISYRQSRTWHFSPEESVGTMDDSLTTINGVALTAAYMMRQTGYLQQKSVDMALGFTKQRISVTHSVRDLLFDGYNDNLMAITNRLPSSITSVSSPFDKFAWFYLRNSSFTYDGWFNLDTGAEDMSRLGTIRRWNNKNHTGFYPGQCGSVKGFTGDMFPPGLVGRESKLNLFSHDLCRSLPFDYSKDVEVLGIQGYRFQASLRGVDNDTLDQENCYCNGECVPSGFLNLTACRFGAPVFVSFPHFYDANPLYLNKVEGLHPNAKKHKFYAIIEPTYGIPIDVGARVQLNMLLQPVPHISMYRKVPKLMFPVLWVDQRVTISPYLARQLRMVILLPTLATVAGASTLSLGTVLFVITLVLRARRKKVELDSGKPCKNPLPVDIVLKSPTLVSQLS